MPKIRIYSTATCGYCKSEKAYLDENGIAYEDIMVDADPVKAKEMIELSGQMGVPFTVITKDDGTEEHILGFDQPKLDAALGLKVA
ncbi:MAG TPA: glutaredoxin family protein [Candidatus Saccharimonadales bacterium]|nr:glutaredoxin family protein [Candidatus Saccharimonadales bacterium]